MKLAEFIEREIDDIVAEWEEFARTHVAAAKELPPEALRDHAKPLMLFIAADMETAESGQQQYNKARGDLPGNAPGLTTNAHLHGQHRFNQGFSLDDMVAEYRALRAAVVRLWREQIHRTSRGTLDELVRFDEAIDQALTESISFYASKVEESRSLLLGVLGHDLRNPLAAVRSSAAYLSGSDGLTRDQAKEVARIVSSSARMREMIDDLLDFTRTRLGRALPISPAPADLGAICRQAVEELRAVHPERRLILRCSGELSGRWDALRIVQMLSNLMANAIQHGEPQAPVTVTVRGGELGLTIQVHNQGPPIAPQARALLFEPLMRDVVQEAERQEGSSGLGLGLYIARQIVVAHGGTIEVASSEPAGTTFTIRLPRRRAPGRSE